jgi:hypothetical protein
MPDCLNQNGSVLRVTAPGNAGESLWYKFSMTGRQHHFVGQDTFLVLRTELNTLSLLKCDKVHEATLQDLLETANDTPHPQIRIRTYYVLKLIMSLKLRKGSGICGMWAPS